MQTRGATPSNVRGPLFQESADGAYLLPTSLASNSEGLTLPLLSAFDGSIVRAWSLPARLPQSAYFPMPVLLDPVGQMLYMLAPGVSQDNSGLLAVAPFDPTQATLQFVWNFQSYQIRGPDNIPYYPEILPSQAAHSLFILPGRANHTDPSAQTLLVYSSYPETLTPFPADASDMLWSFSSVAATRCGELYQGTTPTVEMFCTYCDDARGQITARTCAYCVASGNCTDLPLIVGGDASATCTDPGYPLSVDAACMPSDDSGGGPASEIVAILVGVGCGIIVLVSLGICWMSKRPAAASADSYQNI